MGAVGTKPILSQEKRKCVSSDVNLEAIVLGFFKDKDSGGSTSKKEPTSTSEKASNKSSKTSKAGGDN